MEDALGWEQGFKGPASSWVPLAQQGIAGEGWNEELKGRSFLSGASIVRGAERDCRRQWRGLGWEELDRTRKEEVLRGKQHRERCRGRGIPWDSSRASPHAGGTDLGVGCGS